jgi:hypothetical protein
MYNTHTVFLYLGDEDTLGGVMYRILEEMDNQPYSTSVSHQHIPNCLYNEDNCVFYQHSYNSMSYYYIPDSVYHQHVPNSILS